MLHKYKYALSKIKKKNIAHEPICRTGEVKKAEKNLRLCFCLLDC